MLPREKNASYARMIKSSINCHPTFQYSQPDEYHFSHDSVFLARKVHDLIKLESSKNLIGLDLCAGCGIVGLDLLFHFQGQNLMPFREFEFIEVQEIYFPHFKENIKHLPHVIDRLKFSLMNYSKLCEDNFSEKYDLIVSNPPFFIPDQGILSPSEFKNRCRFFIDASFETLIKGIANSLKVRGQAYLLIRNLEPHGIDLIKVAQGVLSPSATISFIGDVRGTNLAKITKVTPL